MRVRIWWDFFIAVATVFRRPDPEAIAAERRRGVERLAREVIERDQQKPARER